uniref:Uncharacterized protein n=1 Tax=Cannabis sativa TaxID=3483 RepID=A0A803QS99_CANSA
MDPLTSKMKGVINLEDEEESVLAFDEEESPNLEITNDHSLLARVLTRKQRSIRILLTKDGDHSYVFEECGCLGHPYQKCSIFLELLDNGLDPELAYGPEIKGAALPTSGYDRYRTDFSKGNAWPLLTQLARKVITTTIPSFPIRNQPQPRKLL